MNKTKIDIGSIELLNDEQKRNLMKLSSKDGPLNVDFNSTLEQVRWKIRKRLVKERKNVDIISFPEQELTRHSSVFGGEWVMFTFVGEHIAVSWQQELRVCHTRILS